VDGGDCEDKVSKYDLVWASRTSTSTAFIGTETI